MTKTEYFKTEESPYYPGKWTIVPVHEAFCLEGLPNGGSYNIICARLMGLSYAQYLRFCRDILKAEVYGKKSTYPVAYFKNDGVLRKFVRLLNNRAHLVMWERKHPNWSSDPTYSAAVDIMKELGVSDVDND